MTVITAAIKDGKVCISADTQLNFGSLKVHAKYVNDRKKLFPVQDSVIGMTGWSATSQILEHLIETEPKLFNLKTRWQIFETLLAIQDRLKNEYFIETNEDSDQPVESNQLDGLIINSSGIFQFGSYREVHQYEQFWALGSGRRFALGAMHALYESGATAQQIAEAGVHAAAEFDDGCNLPCHSIVLDMEKNAGNE